MKKLIDLLSASLRLIALVASGSWFGTAQGVELEMERVDGSGGKVQLRWDRAYYVERSNDLSVWEDLDVVLGAPRTLKAQKTISLADFGSHQYFRLKKFQTPNAAFLADLEVPANLEDPPGSIIPVPALLPPRYEPTLHIRIKAVRTAVVPRSGKFLISPEEIQFLIDQANAIFREGGIQFLFNPAEDLEDRVSSVLNDDFTLFKDLSRYTSPDEVPILTEIADTGTTFANRRAVADANPDAITVFFSSGGQLAYDDESKHWGVEPVSQAKSSATDLFIRMPATLRSPNSLARALALYLNNKETFARWQSRKTVAGAVSYFEALISSPWLSWTASNVLQAVDGDSSWVRDTDPHLFISSHANCSGDTVPIPTKYGTFFMRPPSNNLLSGYHVCNGITQSLSDHQIQRARDCLLNGNRYRLIGNIPASSESILKLKGEATAGPASKITIMRTRARQLVTCHLDPGTQLQKLISWEVDASGELTQRDTSEGASGISQTSVDCVAAGRVVAYSLRGPQELRDLWYVNRDGQFDYHSTKVKPNSELRKVQWVHCSRAASTVSNWSSAYIYTSVIDQVFHQTDVSNALIPLDTTPVSAASDFAGDAGIVRLFKSCPIGTSGKATTWKSDTGNLIVSAWDPGRQSDVIEAEEISEFSLVPSHSEIAQLDTDLFCTLTRASVRDVKLINWRHFNGQLTRRATRQIGGQNLIRVFDATRVAVNILALATIESDGRLELSLWDVGSDGEKFELKSSVTGPDASEVSLCPIDKSRLAVAIVDTTGNLKVMIWDTLRSNRGN